MIQVTGLCKSYGKNRVLRNLSFTVEAGEKIFLSAPSGAGKTTLLRILSGLESADKGEIRGIAPGSVSYCFQEPRLFPQLTALQNLTCILPDPEAGREAAEELLRAVGLEDAAEKYPDELSGGMKQRVALARALITDRPIVLLDEPFTALDPERKESVRALVSEACREKTLILVSHDPEDRESLTHRSIYL